MRKIILSTLINISIILLANLFRREWQLFIPIYENIRYLPEQLPNVPSVDIDVNLYDPDQLLTLEFDSLTEIKKITKNIKSENKFDTYIYVISYISENFVKDQNKDIERFTNDLSYFKLNGDFRFK